MTNIVYDTYYDTHILECTGHTEYSEGTDILCSAVSALCHALGEYLREAYSEGKIADLKCSMEKGFFMISFRAVEDNPVLEGVSSVICGFKVLEKGFPEYISLDA